MSSEAQYEAALRAGEKFEPTILSASYDQANDSLKIETRTVTFVIKRASIEPFRNVPPEAMKQMLWSPVGLHVDEYDVDVSSAGLINMIAHELVESVGSL